MTETSWSQHLIQNPIQPESSKGLATSPSETWNFKKLLDKLKNVGQRKLYPYSEVGDRYYKGSLIPKYEIVNQGGLKLQDYAPVILDIANKIEPRDSLFFLDFNNYFQMIVNPSKKHIEVPLQILKSPADQDKDDPEKVLRELADILSHSLKQNGGADWSVEVKSVYENISKYQHVR